MAKWLAYCILKSCQESIYGSMTALYFLYKYIIFPRAIIHSRNVNVSKVVMKSEGY